MNSTKVRELEPTTFYYWPQSQMERRTITGREGNFIFQSMNCVVNIVLDVSFLNNGKYTIS